MRRLALLAILVLSPFAATGAMADPGPKPSAFFWWPGHWNNQTFIPYLDDGTHPHNTEWDYKHWQADDWIRQNKDGLTLVKKFYTADIIRRQYVRHETPVVVVGPAFYELGGEDKRRVMAVLDNVWKITSSKPDGMFMLYDWDSGEAVGSYTQGGLQIQ